jgi:hypothetical protein
MRGTVNNVITFDHLDSHFTIEFLTHHPASEQKLKEELRSTLIDQGIKARFVRNVQYLANDKPRMFLIEKERRGRVESAP